MGIYIAYPHLLVGKVLEGFLSERWDVQDVCADKDQVVERATKVQPDVALVSAGFPEAEGIVRGVVDGCKDVAVVVTSGGSIFTELDAMLKAGASAYVTLDCSEEQLIQAIDKAAAGEIAVFGVDRRSIGARKGAETTLAPETAVALKSLTPREREILELLSKGSSNRDIAESLFLSEHTVRTHIQNLRSKLNVRSKFQAAMVAIQAGVVAGSEAPSPEFVF